MASVPPTTSEDSQIGPVPLKFSWWACAVVPTWITCYQFSCSVAVLKLGLANMAKFRKYTVAGTEFWLAGVAKFGRGIQFGAISTRKNRNISKEAFDVFESRASFPNAFSVVFLVLLLFFRGNEPFAQFGRCALAESFARYPCLMIFVDVLYCMLIFLRLHHWFPVHLTNISVL